MPKKRTRSISKMGANPRLIPKINKRTNIFAKGSKHKPKMPNCDLFTLVNSSL